MQTGRRPTGAAPARTGTAPAKGPGGLGNIMQKWNDLDGKMKMIIIVSFALVVCVGIGFSLYSSSNKMVPLYSTNVSSADIQAMQTKLSQMGVKHEVAEGGINIMVLPKDKSRTIMLLASQGLPSRPLAVTSAGGKDDAGGLAPPTGDEKERKYLQQQTGDLVVTIRQIEGVSDAYLKIVPKPKGSWGEETGSATASVLLRLTPGARLSQPQINGIVSLIAYSIEGLDPKNIKVMDTTGKVLNDSLGNEGTMASDGGNFTTKEIEEKKAQENILKGKVKEQLSKIFGGMEGNRQRN
jgi:flagellar M-ring protein FliF